MVYFLFFLISGVFSETASYFMAQARMNDLWVLHIHHAIEFGLLMYVLARWQRQPVIRSLELLLIPIYLSFWLVSIFTYEKLTSPAEYTHTLSSTILIAASIATLFGLMKGEDRILYADHKFWVCAGVLVYFTSNIMLFLFINRITGLSVTEAISVWSIHWVLDIISNVLYTVGFLCLART